MVRLWIREDGERPKAIARDATSGPGPGAVVEVRADSADDARLIYATSRGKEPDELGDPQGWLEWRRCKRLVTEISPD